MLTPRALLLASFALLIGLAAYAPAARADQPPPGIAADEPIADRELLDRAVAEGDRLIAAGRTTKTAALVEQLSRAKASAALAPLAADARPLDPEDVYERARRATLVFGALYKCPRCAHTHFNPASGFVISETGLAVTNYHVIASAGNAQPAPGENLTLVAATADGRVLPVKEVLAADKETDVAVVQLQLPEAAEGQAPPPKLDALPVRPDAKGAKPGADVYVLSHPNNRLFSFTRGTVSRYFRGGQGPNAGKPGAPVFMQITADYARGSSGGPVLNARGEVVGMVAATTSVYYNDENGTQKNLQMVFKDCVPASAIRALVGDVWEEGVGSGG